MKLVLVIEIAYCNQGIESPNLYPREKYPSEWDSFRVETHKKAGFKMPMDPYQKGQFIFEPYQINDENLTKLVKEHIDSVDNAFDTCPLFGGYILKVGLKELLYPQCCGDLSDLSFWRSVANGDKNPSWEAHPVPLVTYSDDRAFFRCEDEDESFDMLKDTVFEISKTELKQAVAVAEVELTELCERIKKILVSNDLPAIEDYLTFGITA